MLESVEPEIRYRSPHEICATWGAVVIRICDGARTEIDDLQRLDALFDEMLETRPAIGMLLVITHETPLPTPATQRYTMRSLSSYGDKLTFAVAALGLGFWASAFRTAVDTVVRVIRLKHIAIEGNVEGAIERLASELIGIEPDALLSAYQSLWNELEHSRMAS